MTVISNASLERCSAIAAAIDEELKRNIEDRKDLYIRTAKPRSIKGELEAYKTQLRQDWKGKFWMVVHKSHVNYGPCLQIAFQQYTRRRESFEIVRHEEDTVEIFQQDVGLLPMSGFTSTEARSLNDEGAAMFVLMENPINMKLDLSMLSERTLLWLDDQQNNEPSPLINMLMKRGYLIERRGAFLWVHRGGEA